MYSASAYPLEQPQPGLKLIALSTSAAGQFKTAEVDSCQTCSTLLYCPGLNNLICVLSAL